MYVKEITIDGFKSYAKRVTVQGLDPHFNAITGLNGSGKSNILDSICFVLGIKNLSQVRASNLQELVYKQGHAGISKATVCVTFVNNDPENGPQGYADCKEISVTRQIVIGGRDKYMINGRQSTAMRVQDLFHSVQLNVNNPHFLIMQGRITKVLNMKPPEILGLLEEAAGTKMYEKKRDVAMRTLQKKDMKLQEIDELLEKELQPSLERLRVERGEYQRYQHELSSMDRLKRFVVAWQHHEADGLSTRGHGELQQLQQELQQNEVTVATLQEQLKDLEKQAEAMEQQQGGRMKERLARAQAAASEASKKLVEASTKCDNLQELLQAEQQAQDKTKERMKELDDATLLQAVQAAQAARDQAQAQLEAAQQAVAGATTQLAGAEEGDCRDAQNRSVQEQLAHLQNQQTAAGAAAQQAEVKVKHLQKEVDARRAELSRKEKGGSGLQAELRKAQDAVQACQQQLQALQYDAEAELQVKQRAEASEAKARRLRTEVDELAATLGGVDFEFRDPHQGFDRSKVKGVVAKLVSVKDAATVTALEVAAGGKLYQVVVDSDDTGKKLLQRGGLKRRCTIIPLTKIRADTLPAGKQQRARQLAGSRAQLALELVGYDREVENAMRYVFGSSFVCQDAKTAQLLALKSDVRARSISLQGDDYNPSGTLTGGSRSSQASLLTRLHRLGELQQQLDGHQAALAQANRELQALAPVGEQHTRLTQQLEVQQHSLELLQQRMQGSERQQLAAQVAALEGQLAQARDDLQEARREKKEAVDGARSLEEMVRNFSRDKDKYVKAAKKKLEAAKAELQTRKAAAAAQEQALQIALAERESGAASREELAAQLQAGAAALAKMEADVAAMREQVQRLQQQHQAAQSEAAAVQEAMSQQREEARQLGGERIRIGDAVRELQCSRKALEHAQAKKQRRVQEAGDTCARLEKDPQAVRASYEENAASISKLEKKVNRRVLQMCDQCEQEVQELMQKRSIVAKDKHKIEQVIGELDLKKRESLKETWKKVNQDFGSIFSTLLPGTSAKLEPPESADGDFMQGLEVRVAFGGVWKESLSELSGGQRSLLALSIILSLLLFKPAPIYILDEVDAALDLSHTQNIGRMIKRHFPYSQFIIVSLKSGMFDNANVIFRTKFVDGVSSVTRTVNRARPAEQEAADDSDEPQQGGQKVRGRQRPPLQENVRW